MDAENLALIGICKIYIHHNADNARDIIQKCLHSIILWRIKQQFFILFFAFITAFKKYDPILRHFKSSFIFPPYA